LASLCLERDVRKGQLAPEPVSVSNLEIYAAQSAETVSAAKAIKPVRLDASFWEESTARMISSSVL
jgi:hypothetical protein